MKALDSVAHGRGVALVAGLVLLAALSLLAMVATASMILQHRMAGNQQENHRSLQNASVADGWAGAWLNSRADDEREPDCVVGCILPSGIRNPGTLPARPEHQGTSWWLANGIEAGANPLTGDRYPISGGQSAETPRWIMEEVHFEPAGDGHDTTEPGGFSGVGYYRILGWGTGKRPGSVAVTESIVARPWGGHFMIDGFPAQSPESALCAQFGGGVDCGRLAWRQLR